MIYKKRKTHHTGYIAIVSVLVIGVVVFAIGMSVSLLSISEGQLALSGENNERALHLTEGCAEDALLRLNKTHTLPASIVLPEGTCTITINSHVGNNWTFTVAGTLNTLTKRIQISATRTSKVTVTSWLEI